MYRRLARTCYLIVLQTTSELMTPIVSIDIGQVGNKKNDSGTAYTVQICVFNFACLRRAVRRRRRVAFVVLPFSSLVGFLCWFIFSSLSSRSLVTYAVTTSNEPNMSTASDNECAIPFAGHRAQRNEPSYLSMSSMGDEQQSWPSTFERLFYSYQRYNELRRTDDAIK